MYYTFFFITWYVLLLKNTTSCIIESSEVLLGVEKWKEDYYLCYHNVEDW